MATLDIFGDDPRALAVNAAGTEVYAVVLESGNQSTTLFHDARRRTAAARRRRIRRAAARSAPAPDVGLIVQFNPASGDWEDEDGNDWSSYVDFNLPDNDVFVIDADAGDAVGDPPARARRHRSSSTSPSSPAPATCGCRTPTRATWCASSPTCAAIWWRRASPWSIR